MERSRETQAAPIGRRLGEALGFLVVTLGAFVVIRLVSSTQVVAALPLHPYAFGAATSIVSVAAIACFAFAAGWRRSWLDLLAVILGISAYIVSAFASLPQ